MALSNKRIIDLPERSALNSDDYTVVDGSNGGTGKYKLSQLQDDVGEAKQGVTQLSQTITTQGQQITQNTEEITDLKEDLTENATNTRQKLNAINTAFTDSVNLLDTSALHSNHYVSETGDLLPYNGYTATYAIPAKENTQYQLIFYYNSTGLWRNDTAFAHACFDVYGNFLEYGLGTFTTPSKTDHVIISFNTNRVNQYAMFGKYDALNEYVGQVYVGHEFVPYGHYIKVNHAVITQIVNPYVFYQWNGYCYFKFDSIQYFDLSTKSIKTLQYSDLKTQYPDYINASNGSKVIDCCNLLDGYYFVYSTTENKFIIKNAIAETDILLLAHSNGKMYGLLYKEYNDRIQYYYDRGVYNAISPDVLNNIDSTIDTNVMRWIDDDYFIFGYVGDNHQLGKHIGVETDMTGMAIGYTDNAVGFDAILNAGDEILTVTSAGKDTLVSLRNAFKFYDADKMVMCEGNHDRGTTANTVITRKEYFDTVLRRYRNDNNVHLIKNKAYYYRDYPKHKIRVICLTPYNFPENDESFYPYVESAYGYDQAQMEWLCNTALQIASDWDVIIMTHTAPVTSAEGITGNGTGGINPLVLRGILESFKGGTDEHITFTSEVANGYFNIDINTAFASQGSRKIIGVFSGHTHLDNRVVINGINYITIACGYVDHASTPSQREGLTYSAICFDVVSIIKSQKRIIHRRIGYGANRAFYYE